MRLATCRDGGQGMRIGRHGVVTVLAATLLAQWSLCGSPSKLEAQSGKDVGKALLRALIESQLDRDDRRGQFRPGPGQPIPAPVPTTAEMQRLRPIAASLAQESANFSNLLAADGRYNREIRQSATDALRWQASVSALQQRAAIEQDHRRMIEGYRNQSSDCGAFQEEPACPLQDLFLELVGGFAMQLAPQFCQVFVEQFHQMKAVKHELRLGQVPANRGAVRRREVGGHGDDLRPRVTQPLPERLQRLFAFAIADKHDRAIEVHHQG